MGQGKRESRGFLGLKPGHFSLLVSKPVELQLVYENVSSRHFENTKCLTSTSLPSSFAFLQKSRLNSEVEVNNIYFSLTLCSVKNSESIKTNMVFMIFKPVLCCLSTSMLFITNCLPYLWEFFNSLFQQFLWFLKKWIHFIKWCQKEHNIKLCIHNASRQERLNSLHVTTVQ